MNQPAPSLVKLKDTDFDIRDRSEDIRGRKVLDAAGESLGEISGLFVDEQDLKVRMIEVASGGILGLGESKSLIPIEALTAITDDEVHIDQERQRVAGAPRYDPELIEKPSWVEYYAYYGYPGYWTPGYVYPAFPLTRQTPPADGPDQRDR